MAEEKTCPNCGKQMIKWNINHRMIEYTSEYPWGWHCRCGNIEPWGITKAAWANDEIFLEFWEKAQETVATDEFVIRVMVEPDGDTFHSFCPALKGLHSQGNTREEALCNALEAAYAYLSSVIKHGEAIPEGITAFGDSVIVCRKGAIL